MALPHIVFFVSTVFANLIAPHVTICKYCKFCIIKLISNYIWLICFVSNDATLQIFTFNVRKFDGNLT